jgi:hypothetical protein
MKKKFEKHKFNFIVHEDISLDHEQDYEKYNNIIEKIYDK